MGVGADRAARGKATFMARSARGVRQEKGAPDAGVPPALKGILSAIAQVEERAGARIQIPVRTRADPSATQTMKRYASDRLICRELGHKNSRSRCHAPTCPWPS